MKVFQVNDLQIASLTIIADDINQANHIFLQAIYEGLRHWPKVEYTIREMELVDAKQTAIVKQWASEHRPGIAHRCNDGGWELIPPRAEV